MSTDKVKMLCSPANNRSLTSVLLLSLSLLATISCSHRIHPASSPLSATAQFDKESLEKLSRYLLRPPIRTSPPEFLLKESTVYYYLGNVLLEDGVPTSATTSVPQTTSDPFGIALKDQLRIELIRQHISSPENKYLSFIEPALERSEAIISHELKTLRNSRNSSPPAVLAELDVYSQEISKTIDRAIQQYALERQLNVFHVTRKTLAAVYEVMFKSIPPGGVISYVTEFDRKVALKNGSVPPWRVVAAPKTRLNAGSYRVHVVWPDFNGKREKRESEYTIDIAADGELNLRYLP